MSPLFFYQFRFPKRLFLKYGLGLFLPLMLLGCGGGGSSTPPIEVPSVTPVSASIIPGAFICYKSNSTCNLGGDWVSILAPSSIPTSGIIKYYALHYIVTDPDIYSSSAQAVGTNLVSLNKVTLFPDNAMPVSTGTGTITGLPGGEITTTLNFPTSGTEEKRINIPPSGFNIATPATLTRIEGSWTGRWSYSMGSAGIFTINVSPDGAVTSSNFFQNECRLTQGRLTPNVDGSNLLSFSVTIPASTLCTSFGGQTLVGAAFVTSSPDPGKTMRLYIVGVTPDGRGISFKADR